MWILSHGGKKMMEIGEENTKWTASKEKWIGWVVFDVAANLILSTLGSCCNDKHYFQKVPGGHQEHPRCIGRNGHSEAPCWRLHMRILTIICRSIAISFILDFFFLYRLSTCLHVQSCPTLCNPKDCSAPGLPVSHHLPKFAQVHIHCISDAIQPSHLLTPSSSALNLSQHQGQKSLYLH